MVQSEADDLIPARRCICTRVKLFDHKPELEVNCASSAAPVTRC
jgi:hypothetical protein